MAYNPSQQVHPLSLHGIQGGHDVPLGERIKLLRKERGWGQSELAEKIASDARQISRYENGKIVPSVEAIIKIAQAFDVSIDYLLLDDVPRRPLRVQDAGFLARFQGLENLSDEDKASLLHVLDALLAKNKLKALAREVA
jgi:transcriptional regulator with XRE-family HTH domain